MTEEQNPFKLPLVIVDIYIFKKKNRVKKSERSAVSTAMRIIVSIFFIFLSSLLPAQQSLVFTQAHPDFRNAMDLFEKEKYVPAQQYFSKAILNISDVHSEVRIDAEYYKAICAVRLFHADAEALLVKFIEDHPESSHLLSAYLNLAKFQFRKRKYEDVLNYLAEVDPLDLSSAELEEYHFKKGYSHFQLEEYDKAAVSFYEIKDTDNPYVSAARYYYAHIAYTEGKYQTASENFSKIADDRQFGPIVPYYLTQIYYLQGKYEQLLAYAPAVLDSAPPKKENEIRKLIGDAYYETGQYEKALPNLEQYLSRNQGTPEDYYQVGFTYFQTGNYEQAINALQKSIGDNDTLSQSAYYIIGRSSFDGGNKNDAKAALRNAWKLDIDKEITEDALFNYAKVSYELDYHPYDDAILAFEEYINNYPNSSKLNDAYEYLVGVYYTTKNYEKALESIDRIKRKDIKLLRAKQRLAYYRGVELFQNSNYIDAVDMFHLSLKNNYEPKLKASALFWMAESFFRLGDYDNAESYYSDFLASSFARSLEYYNKGYYNIAYSYYERKKYSSAIFWFKEYLDNAKSKNKGLINDANLRIGDSYFIQSDYKNAITYYNEAANTSMANEDYAILQAAISYGVLGNYNEKSKKLKQIVNENKSSVYVDDALFELGKNEERLRKNDEALSYYNQLVSNYPNSNYLAETYLNMGLIYFNKKQDEMALSYFDKVVKNYSGTPPAKGALDKISQIYIDKGDAEGYQKYISGVPFADISKNELDSTSYVIAENAYLTGNCEKATRDFTNYLKQYPSGLFSLNAHYYRGDCELKSDFNQEAARDFEYIIGRSQNKFTEKALVALGGIYLNMQEFNKAVTIYERLLSSASRKENKSIAEVNLMKIHFEKKEYEKASKYATNILSKEQYDVKTWQQAKMTLAKTSFEKENYKTSISHLDTLSKAKNRIGAEAKYLLAKIYYLQGMYDKSDTMIYELVDQVPSFPYWIASGFILLADNFIAKDDIYNARLTFQSVIDNADDSELIDIAREKLRMLNEAEGRKMEKENDPMEIDMSPDNLKNDKLFDADSTKTKKSKK